VPVPFGPLHGRAAKMCAPKTGVHVKDHGSVPSTFISTESLLNTTLAVPVVQIATTVTVSPATSVEPSVNGMPVFWLTKFVMTGVWA
jgi:hypothetical protein